MSWTDNDGLIGLDMIWIPWNEGMCSDGRAIEALLELDDGPRLKHYYYHRARMVALMFARRLAQRRIKWIGQ